MGYRILAFLEDNVATVMLIASRLGSHGHRLVVVSSVDDFERRLEVEDFDWIVLDGAIMRDAGAPIRSILSRRLRGTRIAWIGEPPHFVGIAIVSRFSAQPSYDAVADAFRRLRHDEAEGFGDPARGRRASR